MKKAAVEALVRAIGVEVGSGLAKHIGVQVGAKIGRHIGVGVGVSIVRKAGVRVVVVIFLVGFRSGARRPRLSSRFFGKRGLTRGAPVILEGRLEIPQVPLSLPKLGVQVGRFGPESPQLAARHAA